MDTIQVARRCRRIILQDFAGTVAVDGLGIVLAAFGLLNPVPGAVAAAQQSGGGTATGELQSA